MMAGLGQDDGYSDPSFGSSTGTASTDLGLNPYTGLPLGGSGTPVSSSSSSSGFWNAISAALTGSSKILTTRYAVPQLNPGQFISTTPYGSTQYQLAPGQTTPFSLSSLTGSSSSLLLLAGAAVIVLMMVKK